ncbi:hypothetical protein J5X84_15405 [Streptosporangiaceae bacterium NEAU-GS5]|nr:hypothetical protein [Streptosporangiaceae bacterium NEAU-GS5]
MRFRKIIIIVATLAAAAGLVAFGRVTADTGAAYRSGREAGLNEGLRDGRVAGLREGRALQVTTELPASVRPPTKAAFESGYVSGMNDVFSGYDGGWSLSTPYVITLQAGTNGVTYRLASRIEFAPGINYHLCPATHTLCQESRPR